MNGTEHDVLADIAAQAQPRVKELIARFDDEIAPGLGNWDSEDFKAYADDWLRGHFDDVDFVINEYKPSALASVTEALNALWTTPFAQETILGIE